MDAATARTPLTPAVGAAPIPDPDPTLAVNPPRSLAPDLARGMLLLFIAVANVWGHLYGRPTGIGGRPLDGSALDHVVDGLVMFLADDRSRPMFAILYGYGLATMAARMAGRGVDERGARRVLRRRSLWLVAFGAVHAALLFSGDILGVYGAVGLVALLLVHRSRAVLLRWLWGSLASMLVVTTAVVTVSAGAGVEQQEGESSYLAAALVRLGEWAAGVALSTVALLVLSQVVIGILVARAGWLDRPTDHGRTLGRVVAWALAINLVGNLPAALAVAGVWSPQGWTLALVAAAHLASGVVMGLGYVALAALVAARWQGHAGAGRAVAAVGERSLTSYLLQSVLLAPLLSAWGLGLGATLGTAAATALAVGVWGLTVVAAVMMDRAGRRGPFEVLLRRLTYGRPVAPRTGPRSSPGTTDLQHPKGT